MIGIVFLTLLAYAAILVQVPSSFLFEEDFFITFSLADDQWGQKELEDGTWNVFGCSPSHDLFSCHICCC